MGHQRIIRQVNKGHKNNIELKMLVSKYYGTERSFLQVWARLSVLKPVRPRCTLRYKAVKDICTVIASHMKHKQGNKNCAEPVTTAVTL
jgi:hypothetical protein